MTDKDWSESYLRLHPHAAIKRLENTYLYHKGRDDLYEIDDRGERFLIKCDGSSRGAAIISDAADAEFVKYCLSEGLLQTLSCPEPVSLPINQAPKPSLRYLELQLLHRCNLRCRHCYIGQSYEDMLSLDDAIAITNEFAEKGGLRLLISGGEPLLYPYLKEFIRETSSLAVRRVILTNGTLITEKNIPWLCVENIQFSLDGWHRGHEILRGKGTFQRTISGIRAAYNAGIPISVATMIHKGNVDEFERLEGFTQEIGATEWGIDVPGITGSLKQNQDLVLPYRESAPFMRYAYGGGYHGPSSGFACGRHLMTVLPSGKAVKCGFYEDDPIGDAREEGIIDCWLRLRHIPLEELQCRGCPVIQECAGGCRFRASHPLAPDPVMCAFFGIKRD